MLCSQSRTEFTKKRMLVRVRKAATVQQRSAVVAATHQHPGNGFNHNEQNRFILTPCLATTAASSKQGTRTHSSHCCLCLLLLQMTPTRTILCILAFSLLACQMPSTAVPAAPHAGTTGTSGTPETVASPDKKLSMLVQFSFVRHLGTSDLH